MALQLLPVKEMGQLLYNNQLTEEICDALDGCEDKGEESAGKKNLEAIYSSRFFNEGTFNFNELYFIAKNTKISSRLDDDKPTRPPLEV